MKKTLKSFFVFVAAALTLVGCQKKEIELLTEDIPTTIDFLRNECTADEYSWISEVIDDVVNLVPSKEFVQCYKDLMIKFPEECTKYNIAGSIENAFMIS